jgi:hypothetical protein
MYSSVDNTISKHESSGNDRTSFNFNFSSSWNIWLLCCSSLINLLTITRRTLDSNAGSMLLIIPTDDDKKNGLFKMKKAMRDIIRINNRILRWD